jgi:hypothetical protein
LTKLATRRLGCGLGGANDVKRQRFFGSLDWDDLVDKKLPPPWLPDASVPHPETDRGIALARRRGSMRRTDQLVVEACWDEAF